MASQGSQTISLKILIDQEKNRVVMAEAHSDSVDILFSFLTMPMGTIVRLISKQPQPATLGSMTSLYKEMENLEEQLLQTQACKPMLLHPRNPYENECRKLKVNIDDAEPAKYYICADWNCSRRLNGGLYTTFKNVRCSCGKTMDKEIRREKEDGALRAEGDGGVFVRGTTKFMVTDDLQVQPLSTATIVTLMQKLGVKDLSSLQEITLSIGSEEILNLLKESLFSKTPLTDVFLRKQGCTSEGIKFEIEDAVESQDFRVLPFGSLYTQDVNMKLMISKSKNKALYAEAGEDMADFLLSFLTFPLGSILQLLDGNSSLGSMDNLYNSVGHSKAVKADHLRDMLQHPRLCRGFGCWGNPLGVNEIEQPPPFLLCRSKENRNNKDDPYTGYLTTEKSYISRANDCFSQLCLVDPKSSETAGQGGFLKGPATFVVTENLVLKPLDSIWSLSFLKQLKVPLEDLEVCQVTVGRKQALRILKASLFSKSVFTEALVNFGPKSPKQEK